MMPCTAMMAGRLTVLALLDDDELVETAAAPANGFASCWMVACERSNVNCEKPSDACCPMVADSEAESSAAPLFHAAIHDVLDPFRLMVPVPLLHDWQFAHLMLATISPVALSTPEPSSSVTWVAESCLGCVCPVLVRGDTVTLPVPSAYMTKMCAPDMEEPWPRAAHVFVVGAWSCMYMSPLPEAEDDSGTATL